MTSQRIEVAREGDDRRIDLEGEDSFTASDPPSHSRSLGTRSAVGQGPDMALRAISIRSAYVAVRPGV